MPIDVVERSFRCLGLTSSATPAEIRAGFFQLVRRYHPDVNRAPGADRQLRSVVRAYRTIQRWRGRGGHGDVCSSCMRCGRVEALLPALDGGYACADCLLGRTRRRRLLPLPEFITVRHIAVFAMYAAAALVLAYALRLERADLAIWSLFLTTAGFTTLSAQVLDVSKRQ